VRNWRVLTAVAAVILAAGASVLAYTYLTQADARAQDKTVLVPVLVAKQQIPKGTPGKSAIDSSLLEVKKVPREVLPSDARIDDAGLSGLVASSAIAKGQFVVKDSFVAATEINGFSTTVKGGKEALSLSVDMTHGVAGFIQPNDNINVLVTMDIEDKLGAAGTLKTTAFLIPGLRVLAVGSTTAGSAAATTGTPGATTQTTQPAQQQGLITVEATPRQAEQLAHAMNVGTIMLSLNPPNFDAASFKTPAEIVEAFNLFDQPLSVLQSIEQQINNAKPAK
jgi:pilus assembly protein CpaB